MRFFEKLPPNGAELPSRVDEIFQRETGKDLELKLEFILLKGNSVFKPFDNGCFRVLAVKNLNLADSSHPNPISIKWKYGLVDFSTPW
jgi:hypothetical protein